MINAPSGALTFKEMMRMSNTEWLETRYTYLGGSDAAAALGISPFKSRYDLWFEKVNHISKPLDSDAVHWGLILEAPIAEEWARRNQKKIRFADKVYKHKKYPFLCANIDRKVANERALLEIKTTNAFNSDAWDNGVPEHYRLQVVHYLAVTGYDRGYVAVLIGGQSYKEFVIERNQAEIDELIEKELEFWELVQTKTPPRIKEASEILDYAYPESNGETILLEDPEPVERYIEIREKISELEKEKAFMQTLIKAEMEENEVATVDNYIVTWKTGKSGRSMRIKEMKR